MDGSRALAFTELGQLHLDQDDEARAQEFIKRSIELEPDLFDGYWALGTLHEQFERDGEAVDCYLESLSRYPQWEAAIVVRVVDLQTRAGSHDDAEATLVEHLERHPDDDDLRGALVDLALAIARNLDDRPRAIALYDRLLRVRGPAFAAERQELVGDLLLEVNDVEGALEAYGPTVAPGPGAAGVHRKIATAARRLGRWDQAHAELRSALELDQDEEAYRRDRAMTFNEAGNEKIEQSAPAEAVALYQQAIELSPDDAVIRTNLAIGYEALAQTTTLVESLELAAQAMRDAVRLDPDNAEYTARLARLVRSASGVKRYGAQLLTSPVVQPIVVEVSDVLVPKVNPDHDGAGFLFGDIPAMRERIEADRGVGVHAVQLRANPVLGPGRYRVLLWDVPEVEGEVFPDQLFALGSTTELETAGVAQDAISERTDPVTGLAGAWVPATEGDRLRAGSIEAMPDTAFLIRHLEAILRARLDLFFGMDAAVPLIPPSESGSRQVGWARVLRALVRDGVPLGGTELDTALREADLSPQGVPDAIRSARLALAARLPGNRPDADVVSVPDWTEAALETAQGSPPRLTPEEELRLLAELGARERVPGPRVIVTRGAQHRPYLQRLLTDVLGTEVAVVDAAERAAVGARAEVSSP
jgi:tetratricopeptide (TPR) repeat protein